MTRPTVGILHVHTDYSHDGRDTIEALREVSLSRGIEFVGLTDHAEDFDAARYEKYQEHCRRLSDDALQFLPGLEFRFAGYPGLHLLAFGLKRFLTPTDPVSFLRDCKEQNVMVAIAHPVLPKYQIPPDVLSEIDAIEVWNACYNTRYFPDPKAIRLLQRAQRTRPGLVGFAGLDQHDSRNDRLLRVQIRPDGDPLLALKAGRFHNQGLRWKFSSGLRWNRFQVGLLSVLRALFDPVERLHERIGLWRHQLRHRRRKRAT